MNENALELSLANDLSEIAAAAERVDEFCEARAIPPQIAYALNLAIDEILTNTISYGYDDDEAHRIELTLRPEDDRLVLVIVDDGRAFDSSAVQLPDVEASLGDRAVGGLGLFLVHRMMDGVAYRREDGRNVLTLTKSTAPEEDT